MPLAVRLLWVPAGVLNCCKYANKRQPFERFPDRIAQYSLFCIVVQMYQMKHDSFIL